MEFDTYALWIDADASYLRDVVLFFDGGVHALVRVVDLFTSTVCITYLLTFSQHTLFIFLVTCDGSCSTTVCGMHQRRY